MSQSIRDEAIERAQVASGAVLARQKLLRSKIETNAIRANMRAFDARTPKRITRNYLVLGAGGLIAGTVLAIGSLHMMGLLVVPQVTLQRPATPIPASTVAAPVVPVTPPTPVAVDAPIKITPVPALAEIKPTATPPAKISVFQSAPVRPQSPNIVVKAAPVPPIKITTKTPAKLENLSHAKDASSSDELGFKPAANYSIVSIPADGVVMIKKNGETAQQMVRVGGKLPDGEELRSAKPGTKEIETNARKFVFQN